MQEVYRIKLSQCFTTAGIYYENNRDYLVSDETFSKIPLDIVECFTSIKLPFNKREQLGFSPNSPIGASIVDGLYVFADKTPGRQDLINWCILNNLRGESLARLIIELYGDVNKSYYFWDDMRDFVFKYSFITFENFREQLEHRSRTRGTIPTVAVNIDDITGQDEQDNIP
jgi:hypothetical protein